MVASFAQASATLPVDAAIGKSMTAPDEHEIVGTIEATDETDDDEVILALKWWCELLRVIMRKRTRSEGTLPRLQLNVLPPLLPDSLMFSSQLWAT